MVASANRMFTSKGGRVITLQDAVKAGLINANDIPPIPRKGTVSDKEYKKAVNERKKVRDDLIASIANGEGQKALIEQAQQRTGDKFNTNELAKPTPAETGGELTVAKQEQPKARSRWGRLIEGLEESDRQNRESIQRETKIDAQVYGAAAKLLTDAGGQLNMTPDARALPPTSATQPKGKRVNVFKLARQIEEEEKRIEQENLKNTANIFGAAANLMQIRQQQVNEPTGAKRVSGGKKRKQLKGGKK